LVGSQADTPKGERSRGKITSPGITMRRPLMIFIKPPFPDSTRLIFQKGRAPAFGANDLYIFDFYIFANFVVLADYA
jgi:hypothetical protein